MSLFHRIARGLGLGRLCYHVYFYPKTLFRRWMEDRHCPDRDLQVTVHGFPLMIFNPRKNPVGRALYLTGTWEEDVTQAIQKEVKPGMVVVDVGADIGYFSILASKLVGEGGRVLAFEPIPAARQMLLKNIELNSARNIRVYDIALGKEEGTMVLEKPLELSRLKPGKQKREAWDIEVDVRIFDRLEGIPRVGLIKMDVEGAEYDVLAGMRKTIERDHPVLLLELHPRMLSAFGQSADSVHRLLNELGYKQGELLSEREHSLDNVHILWH